VSIRHQKNDHQLEEIMSQPTRRATSKFHRVAAASLMLPAVFLAAPAAATPPTSVTLDAPQGERRDVVSGSWGSARQAQQLERAAIILTEGEVSR